MLLRAPNRSVARDGEARQRGPVPEVRSSLGGGGGSREGWGARAVARAA